MNLKGFFVLSVLGLALAVRADWQTPINMGPVINSSQVEFSPFITMDGSHLYFVTGPVESQDIYVSEYRNGQWQPPVNLGPNINSSYCEGDPTVIGDSMIIFTSNRPSPYQGYPFHFWYSRKSPGGGWEPAQLIGDPVDGDYGEATPWVVWEGPDTLLLFFASLDRPGGQGWWDIWQAQKIRGVWQAPTNIGPPVNTSGLESSPNIWVSPTLVRLDSIRMYFVKDFLGYYADRVSGVWRNPVRLPDIINNGGMDRPSISFENQTVYFISSRPGGYGQKDIWYSTNSSGVESEGNHLSSPPGLHLTALPNPFQAGLTVTLSLDRERAVDLAVYALDGRRVRSLFQGKCSPGVKRLIWDGRDDVGRSRGSGVFFVRLRSLNETVITRLIKMD
jgi:hypothetical protein